MTDKAETSAKARGTNRTERAVRRQLEAMGAKQYDLGLREEATGRFLYRRDLSAGEVLERLGWLAHMNAKGNHVYVRPSGELHQLVLLDDLEEAAVERLVKDGRSPAVVIETSPSNLQAWLRFSEKLKPEHRRSVARALAEEYGGDPSSTDSAHLGRLAGFTNRKAAYRTARGLYPFSLVREATGHVIRAVPPLPPLEPARNPRLSPARGRGAVPEDLPSLWEYHQDPRFGGDLHRADMAWARTAAAAGKTRGEIAAEVLAGRDLSKKGSLARQREYAERTAEKAIAQSSEAGDRG